MDSGNSIYQSSSSIDLATHINPGSSMLSTGDREYRHMFDSMQWGAQSQQWEEVEEEPPDKRFSFKRTPLESRRALFNKLMIRHEGKKVPVILSVDKKSHLGTCKEKYLVEQEMTVGGFMHIIRQSFKSRLGTMDALFLITESNILVPVTWTMSYAYGRCKNPYDGFLYLIVAKENAFGSDETIWSANKKQEA
jgi:hypothetical protein